MCTYSQLKKIQINFVQPPPPPQSNGKDISKCIEGESMKLATQIEYVYM